MSPGFNPIQRSAWERRAPRRRTAARHTDADRRAGSPAGQAAATVIHKETVSQTGQLTGRHPAGIEADRNKHTATGEHLSIVGGTWVKLVHKAKTTFLIREHYDRMSTADTPQIKMPWWCRIVCSLWADNIPSPGHEQLFKASGTSRGVISLLLPSTTRSAQVVIYAMTTSQLVEIQRLAQGHLYGADAQQGTALRTRIIVPTVPACCHVTSL